MSCGITKMSAPRFQALPNGHRNGSLASAPFRSRCVTMLGLLLCFCGYLQSPLWGQAWEDLETIRLRGLATDEIPVVTSVAIHPTAELLATAGDDHLVRLWNLQTGELLRTLRGHGDWVTCVAFCANGERLVTGGRDRRLLRWDLRGTSPPVSIGTHRQPISGLAFHPTTNRLAVVGFRAPLKVYDGETGELLHQFRCPCLDTRTLSFSPNGEWLAAGGRNGKIRIWDLRSQEQFDLLGHNRRVSSVVFASETLLISSGEEQRIHVWDVARRERQHSLVHQSGKVLAMTMMDPTRFAIATTKNVIALCDVRDLRPFRVLHGHTGSVAAIVARGNQLISGSFDTTVRIWKINHSERENQAVRMRHSTALE